MAPVGTSRTAKRNGRSITRSTGGSMGAEVVAMPIAVAAAASVPFSSTVMFAAFLTCGDAVETTSDLRDYSLSLLIAD